MTGESGRCSRRGLATILAWVWVSTILAAYFHQFLPLLPNIWRVLWPH